jgi:hypothetical protein
MAYCNIYGAHSASYPVGTGTLFLEVKRPGREADHVPPSSAEVKNTWSVIFIPRIRGPTQKNKTSPIAREPRVGGERQTAIEHVLTCHIVTRLSSIASLSTSGRIFRYRRVLTLGRKMSDCKSEQRVNIKFLIKPKKSATETFQLLTDNQCSGSQHHLQDQKKHA